jgi:hypothetical protein
MTPHVSGSAAVCVTSERGGIVMVERIIAPVTLAELDYAEDLK